jgi:hypothetical protein
MQPCANRFPLHSNSVLKPALLWYAPPEWNWNEPVCCECLCEARVAVTYTANLELEWACVLWVLVWSPCCCILHYETEFGNEPGCGDWIAQALVLYFHNKIDWTA